jgi:O-acetyl-ADP-ribose deacetylase (regulator of RNase III)
MPYGTRPVENVELDFDALFDEYIAPAARAAGFDVVRSDRESASGVIMPGLFRSIYEADLVIADLTYQNPNVYYELGVRHALRHRGTLLIRWTGGDIGVTRVRSRKRGAAAETAFDIKDVKILSYELKRSSLEKAIDHLRAQIERVGQAINPDSPAFLYLEGLRVMTGSPRAYARDDRTYEILDEAGQPTNRYVGYRSGDFKELCDERAVDFWVNSENVLMQMARVYERSVSSTIRYLGAYQPDPTTPGFDDTIADDLRRRLGNRNAVNQGEVLVTTSGKLRETHGVKAVLHAAVVTGAFGRGFWAIADDLLVETTRTVLRTVRGLIKTGGPEMAGQSVILPLFGTGQGRLDPVKGFQRLLDEVIGDLAYHAASCDPATPDVKTVLFSAFTEEHVRLLQRVLESLVEKGILRRSSATYPAPERSDGAAAQRV